ncbi:hypothetical protein BDV11DRAFT_174044 [Aspergillus similis]
MALRRSERLRKKLPANANPLPPTTKKEKQPHEHTDHDANKTHQNNSTSSNSRSSSCRKRATACNIQAPEPRPLKVLVTEKDHAVQHWLDHGRMPGMPKINPFYEPYCARPKPRRILSTRSQPVSQSKSLQPESRERRRISYDSDDCVRFLIENCCFVIPSDKPTEACRTTCKTLLKGEWGGDPPIGTLFEENIIQRTLQKLAPKSESAIIRAIGELVVPSVDNLVKLDTLVGNRDEPWSDSIPLNDGVPQLEGHAGLLEGEKYYLPRPHPDYSVGLSSLAFTKKQLLKLKPFLGGMNSTSFFRPTAEMHFPFLVSEVKSKTAGLHVATYQSMHSMALCLRGIIYLFRLVKREHELDRMILGFSITHNTSDVQIYGYYPIISGPEITYHTHDISSFRLNSETRWNSYNFVMAVYHKWAPLHLERICSAIEQIPESIMSAEPAQPQATGDSSNSEPTRDLAGSAEWTPSCRVSEAVSGSHDRSMGIASPEIKTGDGNQQKRKR